VGFVVDKEALGISEADSEREQVRGPNRQKEEE
jgi:hypothetical protein